MKKLCVMCFICIIVSVGIFCRKAENFPESNYNTQLSGGAATTFLSNSQSFGDPVSGLGTYYAYVQSVGDNIFSQTFVSAPAEHFGGLGTIYNNVSCVSCHHNDGKGTPTLGDVNSSLLTRISIPGTDENGGPLAAPGFGLQLQDKSNNGSPEAKVTISYTEIPFTFPDGETASLRKPTYTVTNPYIALPANYMISVRLAPPVFGLGLLELIPEATILSNADPDDANNDGISGKANYVYNPYTKKKELGRFGLKANTSTIQVQVASAFQQDIGITSYIFPQESSYGQSQYDSRDDDPEITDSILNATVFYSRTLAVPARRNVNDSICLEGEKIFKQIQCSSCHAQSIRTGVDVRLPMLSNQLIHPYTDLLLHDMGDSLADGRPDYLATGNEWRTMPLWGIGLFQKVNGVGKDFYLHDGRARTVTEAILWHGGEAEKSKQQFVHLSKSDRTALLKFLASL
ncbi:MAG: di-heme oxidoredictase family protein [Arachidicoccus sp.]|nr:di-heme oxidoredictase family protein [Arachidicoccus sp.]